uniref:Phosducin domain-containing protein n=1 Tax=Mesocestoides corti TaxID=53468 RepID=A0A5K3FPZ9_MESCO
MNGGMNIHVDRNTTEDTEFNAILREKGILPPLPKQEEESPEQSPETQRRNAVEKMSYDKLTEEIENLEDQGRSDEDEDSKFLEMYRQKRLNEMREAALKARFGTYGEVTKADWTSCINKAGDGIFVVVHIAQKGNEKCAVVDQHMQVLAARYPAVKFLRGEASLCVPDLPEANLPTVVIYYDGNVKMQYVGSKALGGHPCNIKGVIHQKTL